MTRQPIRPGCYAEMQMAKAMRRRQRIIDAVVVVAITIAILGAASWSYITQTP